MDKIAVVILNWNGCEMLRSFLPSVVRCSGTEGAKIYVADNGSTDASVDMLRKEFPDVHLIILKENLGFGTTVPCSRCPQSMWCCLIPMWK